MIGRFGTLPIVAALLALTLPQGALAGSIIETIGVSTAVGTVLGASTLPFYEHPENNTKNIGYGALAGAGVGLGILIYQWINKGHKEPAKRLAQARLMRRPQLPPDTLVWTPMVSLPL
jgi:hypothetical protein